MIKITERITPKQYLIELLLGLIALFGLYLIVAWSSYSPLDNSWANASYLDKTFNKSGALGAWLMDLCFVLLGYAGHIIPFVLFIAPLYFIRSKRHQQLSAGRVALRLFGFSLLLCGLTVLFTLLFSATPFYLSGGVLGGSLVVNLFFILGKFGLFLCSTILTLVGFVLCSGTSLIYLLVGFYRWLTMKNEDAQSELTTTEAVEQTTEIEPQPEVEEIIIFADPPVETPPTEQTDLFDPAQFAETEPPVVNHINIHISTEKPVQQDFLAQLQPNDWQTADDNASAVDLPNVSLGPQISPVPAIKTAQNQTALEAAQHNLVNNQHISQLISDPSATVETAQPEVKLVDTPTVSALSNVTQQPVQTETVAEVNYKPYGDSLIHPAFQKASTLQKPTTPLPSLDLLSHRANKVEPISQAEIHQTSQRIEQQLSNFGVKAAVKDVLVGPVVTRYELELQPGVKASKVTSIDTDLARALMFRSIRVAESIPGKPYIGIETPNAQRQTVSLREVLDSDAFRQSKALLSMALGKDISGQPVVVDLAKMPHLLVAGSTGSGKSVGVNTMILSLLFRVKPEDVKFIMIDPKQVELAIYNDIPHLLTEVVTDMKKAPNALRWCVNEMERRYQLLSALQVRNIEGFNEKVAKYNAMNMPIPDPIWKPGDTMDSLPPPLEKLSYIVVIVDEFADLMMVIGKQVEELIARLAQKARAIGIHLILATQRPSVDVITGLIKANIPTRIAFTVASKIDSRTILDQAGAEVLLGWGDMLYSAQGSTELTRIQGAYMSDDDVVRVADDWRARGKPNYIDGILDGDEEENEPMAMDSQGELDALFDEVAEFVISTGRTSTSYVQRKFGVGFNRAARIMDQLEEQGIVSPMQNGKREVLARRSSDY